MGSFKFTCVSTESGKYVGKLAEFIGKNHHNDEAALASMISHKMLFWETIINSLFSTSTNALSYCCWGNSFPDC